MKKPANANLCAPTPDIIRQFAEIVGQKNALTDADLQKPYLTEWRERYVGKTPLVLRPATTNEVARIVELANKYRIGIVPQGGNTGLVGGQIPHETNSEILITTEKLNRVRVIDSAGQYIIVEAGTTLANIQSTAQKNNRLFPLSLAAEGSCQIGGNLATNAGGTNVLKYGNARNLVLGLEVVLANGEIWNGLRTLKKDNTGYDLKNLFIGSEGTLGFITAASLKLFPLPKSQSVSMIALKTLNDARTLFQYAESSFASIMTAFEFLPQIALDFVTQNVPGTRSPFKERQPWYVIMEFSSPIDDEALRAMETFLATALEKKFIKDATIATTLEKQNEIWRLREEISSAQKPEGGSIKHDVSVPISQIPDFITRANDVVTRICPNARPVPFGHFGDGNIHYNVSQPIEMNRTDFLNLWEPMSREIHDLVVEMGGSFSAEHGIGRMKRNDLVRYKSTEELTLMRAIKKALDPNGILNPGKLL